MGKQQSSLTYEQMLELDKEKVVVGLP